MKNILVLYRYFEDCYDFVVKKEDKFKLKEIKANGRRYKSAIMLSNQNKEFKFTFIDFTVSVQSITMFIEGRCFDAIEFVEDEELIEKYTNSEKGYLISIKIRKKRGDL